MAVRVAVDSQVFTLPTASPPTWLQDCKNKDDLPPENLGRGYNDQASDALDPEGKRGIASGV
jgi:hypothetical protein